jgi:hypothetical protein
VLRVLARIVADLDELAGKPLAAVGSHVPYKNQLQDLNEKRQHQRLRKRGFTQKPLSERKVK